MKANELMIGDWIKGESNIVARAIEIKDYLIRIDAGIGRGVFEPKELFPIPLTPEILEKNGFKRDPLWHHCDKDLDNYSISVQLGYANKIEYIKIAEKGKDNVIPSERTRLYLTHIKHVHELQRALRLCGINHEIIL